MPNVILICSIVNQEMGFWACLWGITLIMLIDIGRPILIVGEVIPWKRILVYIKQKMSWACIHCSLLTVEVVWPTVSISFCLDFLSMTHYTFNCELKQIFLSWSWLGLDVLSQQQERKEDNPKTSFFLVFSSDKTLSFLENQVGIQRDTKCPRPARCFFSLSKCIYLKQELH